MSLTLLYWYWLELPFSCWSLLIKSNGYNIVVAVMPATIPETQLYRMLISFRSYFPNDFYIITSNTDILIAIKGMAPAMETPSPLYIPLTPSSLRICLEISIILDLLDLSAETTS